jgi:hypothetical protein
LDYSLLPCFEEDRWRFAKKIKDISFELHLSTSTSEVKTNGPFPRPGMMHEECAAMLSDILGLLEFKCMKTLDSVWFGGTVGWTNPPTQFLEMV